MSYSSGPCTFLQLSKLKCTLLKELISGLILPFERFSNTEQSQNFAGYVISTK